MLLAPDGALCRRRYLTANVDPALNVTFETRCFETFEEIQHAAVNLHSVDFTFAHSSINACLRRRIDLNALSSLLIQTQVGSVTTLPSTTRPLDRGAALSPRSCVRAELSPTPCRSETGRCS